eukprot:scaffold71455_cov95-Phaeocystis_antarctica.AAC.5
MDYSRLPRRMLSCWAAHIARPRHFLDMCPLRLMSYLTCVNTELLQDRAACFLCCKTGTGSKTGTLIERLLEVRLYPCIRHAADSRRAAALTIIDCARPGV